MILKTTKIVQIRFLFIIKRIWNVSGRKWIVEMKNNFEIQFAAPGTKKVSEKSET